MIVYNRCSKRLLSVPYFNKLFAVFKIKRQKLLNIFPACDICPA